MNKRYVASDLANKAFHRLFAVILVLSLTSLVFASPEMYDQTFFWKSIAGQPTITVGQYAQSDEFVLSTATGRVDMSSIEFYMSLMDILPAQVTVTMAALYGGDPLSYSPSYSNMMEGLTVTFGPGAACGSSGYDFHLIVDFVAKRTTVEPNWSTMQQCITRIVDYQSTGFQIFGTFHMRLAFYLSMSGISQNSVVLNMNKGPRVRAIFSVVASQTFAPTQIISTSNTGSLTQGVQTEQSFSTFTAPKLSQTGFAIGSNLSIAAGIALGILVSIPIVIFRIRKRSRRQ